MDKKEILAVLKPFAEAPIDQHERDDRPLYYSTKDGITDVRHKVMVGDFRRVKTLYEKLKETIQ